MATENRILEDGSNLITMSGDNRVIQHTLGAVLFPSSSGQSLWANAIRRAIIEHNIQAVVELDAQKWLYADIMLEGEVVQQWDASRTVFNKFADVPSNLITQGGDNRITEEGENRGVTVGGYSISSNILFIPTHIEWQGGIFYRDRNVWRRVESYANVNGEWQPVKAYKKINSTWKRIN